MFEFKDLKITRDKKVFAGTRLLVDDILNLKIIVHDFKIMDSKEKPGTKYLHMQIQLNDKMHVYNTGSTVLQEMIQKIDQNNFPFTTTIIKENRAFIFT